MRSLSALTVSLGETSTVGVVTVVGSGLGARLTAIAELEALLAPFEPSASGAAGDTAWWEVQPEQLDTATRAAHQACQ